MKKIKITMMALLGIVSIANAADEMKWFIQKNNLFQIQAPSTWVQNVEADYFSISSPTGEVSITASAYSKEDGSLEEFAKYRFSSVQEFYTEKTKINEIENGFFQEFEGVWPGETKPTYYVVAALELNGIYISISVVTDRKDFKQNKQMYLKMLKGIKEYS